MSYIHKQLLTFVLTTNPNIAGPYFRLPKKQNINLISSDRASKKKWVTMAFESPQPTQTDKGSSLSRLSDEMKQQQRAGGVNLGLNAATGKLMVSAME